jgi:hypothetical protein
MPDGQYEQAAERLAETMQVISDRLANVTTVMQGAVATSGGLSTALLSQAKAQKLAADAAMQSQRRVTQAFHAARGIGRDTHATLSQLVASLQKMAVGGRGGVTTLRALADAQLRLAKATSPSIALHSEYESALKRMSGALGAVHAGMGAWFAKISGTRGIGAIAAAAQDASPKMGGLLDKMKTLSPIAMLLAMIARGLYGTLKGAVDVNQQFLNSVTGLNLGIGGSLPLFAKMSAAAAVVGVSAEEVTAGLKAVTSAYALNVFSLRRISRETSVAATTAAEQVIANQAAATTAAVAIGKTMGLGKAMGLTTDQTASLIVSLTRMGKPMQSINAVFKESAVAAKASLLSMDDFTGIMAQFASVSMLTRGAADKAQNMMMSFAGALTTATDPISTMIRESGNMAQFTQSMKEFANVVARMDLTQLMAVMGAGGMEANITGMVEKAAQASRPEQMINLLQMIASAAGNTGDQVGVMTMFLRAQGMRFDQALTIAELVGEASRGMVNGVAMGNLEAREQAQKQLANLEATALGQAAVKDPLQTIATLMERLVGLVAGASGMGNLVGGIGGMGGALFRASGLAARPAGPAGRF